MNTQKVYDRLPYFAQRALFKLYCNKLYRQRYGKKFDELCLRLQEFEKYSLAEMTSYQEERLRQLIYHSYSTVPYYNRVMKERKLKPSDINYLEDLNKLPILTRNDVVTYGGEMISNKYRENELIHGHTSGTTGSPLNFYWDRDMWFMNNVFDWRQKRWAGMKLGDPYAIFLGRTIVSIDRINPPFWQYNKKENQMWFSSFHLSEKYVNAIFDEIERFKPWYLEGYPSTLYVLAKLLEKNNLSLKLKGVLTSSETLFENQRNTIDKTFECEVYDYYGQAERVIWGTECSFHCGKHINMDYGITEIVDSQNNLVPDGKAGYLVGTSFLNYGMPFIRYKIGDISAINKLKCNCGSQMPLMANVCTKQEDLILTPSGRYISGSVLTHPFKPLQNIIMSQIVQEKIDNVIVNIVKNENFNKKDADMLIDALMERLGRDITIELKYVEKIPRERNGKFKWVKSLLEKDINQNMIEF